jgi:hypothetical protein
VLFTPAFLVGDGVAAEEVAGLEVGEGDTNGEVEEVAVEDAEVEDLVAVGCVALCGPALPPSGV